MKVLARTALAKVTFHFTAEKHGGKAGGEILWRCGNCREELLSDPEVGDICPTCESEVVAVLDKPGKVVKTAWTQGSVQVLGEPPLTHRLKGEYPKEP